jgi:hypothetical protein
MSLMRIKAFSQTPVEFCHPEAAETLAQPRSPNEGSLHSPSKFGTMDTLRFRSQRCIHCL